MAAGWFDYDRDGKLDLWVVHYAKWSTAEDRYCGDAARGIRIYCHPKYFTGLANSLYRNRGDGTFEDVTAKAGLAKFPGRGMSVAFADYDGDGWPDVFVTNDNMPNFLFHNLGNGTFEEVALLAGAALRDDGKPVASMGAEFKDYDNDGRPDILFTALAGETFPLFRNAGKGNFIDATLKSRVGPLTLRHSGWGLGLFDFNNDGWKDLFSANSHVNDRVEMFEAAVYKEANSVLANAGGVFQDVSTEAGLTLVKAHRGAAFADFDGDGRVDAVVIVAGRARGTLGKRQPGAASLADSALTRHQEQPRRHRRPNPDRGSIRGDDDGRGVRLVERLGRAFWPGRGGADPENRNSVAERSLTDLAGRSRGSSADRDRTQLSQKRWSFYIFSSGSCADELFFRDFDLEFFQEFGVFSHFLA